MRGEVPVCKQGPQLIQVVVLAAVGVLTAGLGLDDHPLKAQAQHRLDEPGYEVPTIEGRRLGSDTG
jgi:hypothetical protein